MWSVLTVECVFNFISIWFQDFLICLMWWYRPVLLKLFIPRPFCYLTNAHGTPILQCYYSKMKFPDSPQIVGDPNEGHDFLGVVLKQLRLLHGQVWDSTTLVNSLSPQMSELVEDAVATWCGKIVWHFFLIRNEFQKLVKLKFEFFSFNTFNVYQIFWQRVEQLRPKYWYCIFLKGLCWVPVSYILNNALYSMSWVFSGFYFVPHCTINIWHHMLCYLLNIYNYIMFTVSLERVQFEFVLSFTVV